MTDVLKIFTEDSGIENKSKESWNRKSYACTEAGCTIVYTTLGNLRRHRVENHNNKTSRFHCKECAFSTAWRHDLSHHYRRLHSEQAGRVVQACQVAHQVPVLAPHQKSSNLVVSPEKEKSEKREDAEVEKIDQKRKKCEIESRKNEKNELKESHLERHAKQIEKGRMKERAERRQRWEEEQ